MQEVLNLLWKVFDTCISVLRNFEILPGVSLFSILICLTLMGIVIRYVVPSAKAPVISNIRRSGGDDE